MKLYLIRHGETDFNRADIVQGGGVDSDLNELGRQQAEAFFAHYHRQLSFDAVYASALKRTHQTLAPWLSLGYSFEQYAALNEFSWGHMEGKRLTPEEKQLFQQMRDDWQKGLFDRKIEGGESPLEAWARIRPFFDMLPERHLGQNLLICTHGRTLRIALSMLLGIGLQRMHEIMPSNTGLHVLHFDPALGYQAERLNDTEHLLHLPSYEQA